MQDEMSHMTIYRGTREATKALAFLRGASFLSHAEIIDDWGGEQCTNEYRELSFPVGRMEEGDKEVPVATWTVIKERTSEELPEVSIESEEGEWRLDPDDPDRLTLSLADSVGNWQQPSFEFRLEADHQRILCTAERGTTLAKPHSFVLRGLLTCGVQPLAAEVHAAWEARQQLPSATVAFARANDRQKMKEGA